MFFVCLFCQDFLQFLAGFFTIEGKVLFLLGNWVFEGVKKADS
jgi:hypothetical protein